MPTPDVTGCFSGNNGYQLGVCKNIVNGVGTLTNQAWGCTGNIGTYSGTVCTLNPAPTTQTTLGSIATQVASTAHTTATQLATTVSHQASTVASYTSSAATRITTWFTSSATDITSTTQKPDDSVSPYAYVVPVVLAVGVLLVGVLFAAYCCRNKYRQIRERAKVHSTQDNLSFKGSQIAIYDEVQMHDLERLESRAGNHVQFDDVIAPPAAFDNPDSARVSVASLVQSNQPDSIKPTDVTGWQDQATQFAPETLDQWTDIAPGVLEFIEERDGAMNLPGQVDDSASQVSISATVSYRTSPIPNSPEKLI